MDKTSTSLKIPLWIKLCLWSGLVCIGQFFIVALIGVIRGYSVQSFTPVWVMLGGVSLLLLGYILCDTWISCLTWHDPIAELTATKKEKSNTL